MKRVIILVCSAVCVSCLPLNSTKFSITAEASNNISLVNLSEIKTQYINVTNEIGKAESFAAKVQEGKRDEYLNSTLKVFNQISNLKYNANNFPFLHKIHARITRSKDAVWATITLTFMCILLVFAVAYSQMWKDHYYSEAQGIPLPNFNERVLFKDVMERKVSLLKQFFKKKRKKNVTELEALLPTSEWDS